MMWILINISRINDCFFCGDVTIMQSTIIGVPLCYSRSKYASFIKYGLFMFFQNLIRKM